MKNIICLILLSLFILLPGCTHNIVYLEVMDDSSLVDIIEKGDVQKYNWLSLHSLYSGWEDEESRCAAYSFIMAECYGYEPADYYVYRSLMDRDTLDNHLRNIAAKYFQKAVENGDTTAIAEMRKTNAAKQKQSSH